MISCNDQVAMLNCKISFESGDLPITPPMLATARFERPIVTDELDARRWSGSEAEDGDGDKLEAAGGAGGAADVVNGVSVVCESTISPAGAVDPTEEAAGVFGRVLKRKTMRSASEFQCAEHSENSRGTLTRLRFTKRYRVRTVSNMGPLQAEQVCTQER